MDDSFLIHYGRSKEDGAPGRGSGRYPLGSGDEPYQRLKTFQDTVKDMRKNGLDGKPMTDKQIAEALNMTTTQLRARISVASNELLKADVATAKKIKEEGLSNVEIGKRMGGIPESTIRNYLKYDMATRNEVSGVHNANVLADQLSKRGLLDVGSGVELHMGISKDKLNTAIEVLRDRGYEVYNLQTEQLGTGKYTTVRVLAPPGTDFATVSKNRDKIQIPNVYTEDGGETIRQLEPPKSVSSKRIAIRYAEDHGTDRDGLIELRRGVDDISLGKAMYAQVRIAVDGTHYLKGMAVYSDDLPPGVDIRFNTNKHKGTPMLGDKDNSVLKPMKMVNGKLDLENPFGAAIKRDDELLLAQRHYKDKNGKEQLSSINIVNEQGEWSTWSKNLPSQFLSKQYPFLAKRQLGLTYQQKQEEYKEIMSLTNPIIKKKLLDSFADECDSAATHLKAAALPRQKTHVILPFPEISDNEIYAPNYRNGETVALVRYPHGGTFEIPVLTVNNNIKSANKIIKNAPDAVGINAKTASILSGADYDGDTAVVLPLKNQKIKYQKPLKELEGFDPKAEYPAYPGMPRMTNKSKQTQMGKVTNLITDMTIRGATPEELAKATRHSMVIIDAEKHNLNWRKSAIDNDIAALKRKYQGASNSGASTLISKASSEIQVPAFKEKINPDGSITREPTGKMRKNRTGGLTESTVKTTRMMDTFYRQGAPKDARALSSGSRIEEIYAAHANKLMALAQESRKASINIKPYKISASAKQTYPKEVASLNNKLVDALKNSPLERKAQLIANKKVSLRIQNEPDMDADKKKKIRGQELNRARSLVGAKKHLVEINDKEWEAIQAHAISSSALTKIMNNTDMDKLKQRATPRTSIGMTPSKVSRAKSMLSIGYTQAEVADALGVSVSTLMKSVDA